MGCVVTESPHLLIYPPSHLLPLVFSCGRVWTSCCFWLTNATSKVPSLQHAQGTLGIVLVLHHVPYKGPTNLEASRHLGLYLCHHLLHSQFYLQCPPSHLLHASSRMLRWLLHPPLQLCMTPGALSGYYNEWRPHQWLKEALVGQK